VYVYTVSFSVLRRGVFFLAIGTFLYVISLSDRPRRSIWTGRRRPRRPPGSARASPSDRAARQPEFRATGSELGKLLDGSKQLVGLLVNPSSASC
jgi:hypothetical protein